MVTQLPTDDLLNKIEAILPKLDGTKSALQADMADCLITLRFLLRKQPNATKPTPKRDRAAYMRSWRAKCRFNTSPDKG